MNSQYSLQPILQPASGKRVTDRRSQVVLILDLNSNQITRSRFGFSRKRLLVTNAHEQAAVVEGGVQVEVRDYETEATPISLLISYQARCRPGDEERLVQRLGGSADPRHEVERQLFFWTNNFVERVRETFSKDFRGQVARLRVDLLERAQRQLGLTLRLRVRLKGEADLAAIPIKTKDRELRVRMEGHFEKYALELDMRLSVDTTNVLLAVQSQESARQLRREVLRATKRFFEGQVTLHNFFFHLSDRVAQALHNHLQEVARPWGRTVEGLSLSTPESLDESIVEKTIGGVKVQQALPDLEGDVEVKCSFLLLLVDTGRYFRAGQPSLDEWAVETTAKVTADVLFSTRYSELIRSYEQKKEEIRRQMMRRADELGFAICQLITITNLDLEELQGGRFSVPVVEENFATNIVGVDAGLEVRVDARIVTMDKVALLLDRRLSVKAAMQSEIRDCVANVLHGVDPEEFYLYFDLPRLSGDKPATEPTLRKRLVRAIRERLTERFDAELLKIIFKPTKTEITELLRELQSKPHRFVVEVEPRGGNIPVVFEGVMVVSAVNPKGWQNFLARMPSMAAVEETVRLALRYRLSEINPRELYHMLSEDMRRGILKWVMDRTSTDYGLAVEITDWWRRPTFADTTIRDNQTHLIRTRGELTTKKITQASEDFDYSRARVVDKRDKLREEAEELHRTLMETDDFMFDPGEAERLRQRLAEIAEELARTTGDGADERLNELSHGLAHANIAGHRDLLNGSEPRYLPIEPPEDVSRTPQGP